MRKSVVGIFASSFEAMDTIDSLRQKGINDGQIHVIVNDRIKSQALAEKAVGQVNLNIQRTTGKQHLIDTGMRETDAEKYAHLIAKGHILVLIDSEDDQSRNRLLSTESIPQDYIDNHSQNKHLNRYVGRPKEKAKETLMFQGQRKEYELDDLNPFENRFPASYHNSHLQVEDHSNRDQRTP